MPLAILEYTDNLKKWDPTNFLKNVHQKLASDFMYPIGIIASRAFVLEKYVLGDGSPDLALAMLTIEIADSHSQEEQQQLREWVIAQLQAELKPFSTSLKIKTGCVNKIVVSNSYAWSVMGSHL